jgi:hypothetical protein
VYVYVNEADSPATDSSVIAGTTWPTSWRELPSGEWIAQRNEWTQGALIFSLVGFMLCVVGLIYGHWEHSRR